MILFLIALSWLVIAIGFLWLMLRLRQRRILKRLDPETELSEPESPSLTVVVPARNEAANIERCVTGLTAQSYPAKRLSILVVDDNSTDDTAAVVRRLAEADSRVQVMAAGPLPSGWTGKSHACWRGAAATHSDWLCFVDADVLAAPKLLSTAMAFAQRHAIDLLSLRPRLEMGSFWERLILSLGVYFYDLGMAYTRTNHPASPQALAWGGFILIPRSVYEVTQGHAAVRTDISEDASIALLVKRAGYRVYMMLGGDLLRARAYTNLKGIWEGLSKNIAYPLPGIGASIFFLLLAWMPVVLPWWTGIKLIVSMNPVLDALTFGLALVGSMLVLSGYGLAVVSLGIPFWYGLLFPVSCSAIAGILLTGAWQRATGRTVWKGRSYDFTKPGTVSVEERHTYATQPRH